MAKLARFEIRPVDDETVRMTVKDSDGLQWSADLSYPVLVDLTRSMPRYLNQLAQRKAQVSDPDVNVTADVVEASGAEVNKTLLGDAVLLAIDDPHGIRTAWRLTPGLAEGLGNDLVKYAKSLKPKATKH